MSELIEKMLAQKKATLQSIANQINVIDEISNQSNNLLLEMEAERSREANNSKDSPTKKPYKYNKKMDQVLPKAIELYGRLQDDNDVCLNKSTIQSGFADFLQQNQLNNQHLSSNVRKAAVIADILQKVVEDDSKVDTSL